MTTPDPSAVDISTQGQKNVQSDIEPFLQNLFTAATTGGSGGGLFNPASNPFMRMFTQQNPAMRAFEQSEGSLLDIINGGNQSISRIYNLVRAGLTLLHLLLVRLR